MRSIFISKRGQSSNLSPLKLIFISKGFALRLVLRQKLESTTRKWPIKITIDLLKELNAVRSVLVKGIMENNET